jgi:hypothetical protein
MPGAADFIQRTVHALEAGGAAVWIKRGLALLAIVAIALFYFIHEFKGLGTSQGMDQAQIGRNIARGGLWKTSMIRPLAVGQLQRNGKDVARFIWHDTYHAPLPSLVNAVVLLPVKGYWKMTPREIIYTGDKVIAATAMLLFLLSLVPLYLTAARLFDNRLALLGTALVLLGDIFWEYSLSGLPQMLLLLLFNCTVYAMVRAVQAQYGGGGAVGVWLGLTGLGFGLMALTHALTIWMFVGALIMSVFLFRPRGWAAAIILAVFTICYAPWLVRNYVVSGSVTGMAIYAVMDGINGSEALHMRQVEPNFDDVGPGHFRVKIYTNLRAQLGRIFELLGWSVAALAFFMALLHVFKRPETAVFRWVVLAMWGGAVLGMALFGLREELGTGANQFHLLFIPIMTCYGLAFLLVQWNRFGIEMRLARIGFITLIFFLCMLPMLLKVVPPTRQAGIHWPPYVPPYISVLNEWMQPNEVIASDMPWAISWYADRPSLWVPHTVRAFTEFHDYGIFGAGTPVNGLYLTPISGTQNRLSDILKGEYKDWAAVILRSVNLDRFPLKWATLLGLENECVFFADRDRARIQAPQ